MAQAEWVPQLEDPEIQAYILDEVGEDGLALALYIEGKEPVTSVDILEDHDDRKPSAVRKILYALMQARIAEYEKDTDAKGWETFVWKTSLNEVKYVIRRRWQDELDHLRTQIRFAEDHEFYACAAAHRRMIFEDALELQFQCPVCQEAMNPAEDGDLTAAMKERLDALERMVDAGR